MNIKIDMNKKITIKKTNYINFDIKFKIINMINIINFIKSNNMITNFKYSYRKHYFYNDKYCLTIYYEYKDICTLKYCKNYTYILIEYIKQYFKDFDFDYESTIDNPNIDIIIQ